MKATGFTARRSAWVVLAAAGLLAVVGCAASDTTSGNGAGGTGASNTGTGAAGAEGGGSGAQGGSTLTADQDDDGFSVAQGDCNDNNPSVHPGVTESCDNGIDDNCNGAMDDSEPDADGDGFGPCQGDCNDADPTISPVAPEIPDDGIDNNCDGTTDGDFDGDGFTVADGDCNDNNADVYPGAVENCFDNLDNNCNGATDLAEPDADGDNYGPCQGDCNDSDSSIHPGAQELPNDGLDNNCDNLVDEDIDADGWTVANGDCNDNAPLVNPGAWELCSDNIDNNCNGVTDTDCLTPCEVAAMQRSSVGCVYYAFDADNYSNMQYAVVVSNIDPSASASVDVQVKNGNAWQSLQSATVGPLALHEFDLPSRDFDGTGFGTGNAYKVVSDLPVIAYQFNPIDGVNSYTTDASLLLPSSALDQYYYFLGWEPMYGSPQVVVIASEDGTTVTVTPTAATRAGGVVPALAAGVAHPFPVMNEGDYLQIEGTASLNGTYVTADKPVSVFSAHDCANIPTSQIACDHLEEQLFGLQTWGNTYVAARMPVRDPNIVETTLWQIIAAQDDTDVSFLASPDVVGLPASPQTLAAGGSVELWVRGTVANPGDFVVVADKPILVMEYLTGRGNVPAIDQNLAGDPAESQAVPVEQFLDKYVVLVPGSWVLDFAILTKHAGATINLDGTDVSQASFTAINDGVHPVQWEVARIPVADGVHVLTGSEGFGIVVVGYDFADSYVYPGGLNQAIINPIN